MNCNESTHEIYDIEYENIDTYRGDDNELDDSIFYYRDNGDYYEYGSTYEYDLNRVKNDIRKRQNPYYIIDELEYLTIHCPYQPKELLSYMKLPKDRIELKKDKNAMIYLKNIGELSIDNVKKLNRALLDGFPYASQYIYRLFHGLDLNIASDIEFRIYDRVNIARYKRFMNNVNDSSLTEKYLNYLELEYDIMTKCRPIILMQNGTIQIDYDHIPDMIYLYNKHCGRNNNGVKKLINHLEDGSNMGNIPCMLKLAEMYITGVYKHFDVKKAETIYEYILVKNITDASMRDSINDISRYMLVLINLHYLHEKRDNVHIDKHIDKIIKLCDLAYKYNPYTYAKYDSVLINLLLSNIEIMNVSNKTRECFKCVRNYKKLYSLYDSYIRNDNFEYLMETYDILKKNDDVLLSRYDYGESKTSILYDEWIRHKNNIHRLDTVNMLNVLTSNDAQIDL
jgi:hypothetical protein